MENDNSYDEIQRRIDEDERAKKEQKEYIKSLKKAADDAYDKLNTTVAPSEYEIEEARKKYEKAEYDYKYANREYENQNPSCTIM